MTACQRLMTQQRQISGVLFDWQIVIVMRIWLRFHDQEETTLWSYYSPPFAWPTTSERRGFVCSTKMDLPCLRSADIAAVMIELKRQLGLDPSFFNLVRVFDLVP